MRNLLVAFAVFSVCVSSAHLANADILQDTDNGNSSWPSGGVIGQSFTADSTVTTLDSIAFYFNNSNQSLRPAPNPTMDLFSGSGFGGTLIDSASLTFAENESDGYRYFDFTGNSLTSGQAYTFRLTQSFGAEGGYASNSSDVYTGGTRYASNGTEDAGDLRFQVQGSSTAVPEPSSLALLGLGALGLFGFRNRKR